MFGLNPDRIAQFERERQRMVESQLRRRGITDPRILLAMGQVPRELFVAPEYATQAYEDHPIPIREGQTISQPFIVALSLQALTLTGSEAVLEIGTGSGYQTALLAKLARQVYSVERHASLARDAETILHQVGLNNVRVTIGDGSYGLTEFAPYAAIVVSAAVPAVPASLLEQLSEHGRIVIPVGTPDAQELQLVRKQGAGVSIEVIEGCRFVPLIGAEGF